MHASDVTSLCINSQLTEQCQLKNIFMLTASSGKYNVTVWCPSICLVGTYSMWLTRGQNTTQPAYISIDYYEDGHSLNMLNLCDVLMKVFQWLKFFLFYFRPGYMYELKICSQLKNFISASNFRLFHINSIIIILLQICTAIFCFRLCIWPISWRLSRVRQSLKRPPQKTLLEFSNRILLGRGWQIT